METSEKLIYLERLQKEYTKKEEKKYFIFQYLNGAGNELGAKFWSPISSSRMAFELYSPLAWDEKVVDFEFEYQLPPMASGGMGPNMDVYIETEDEYIFVESKFTEKADLNYIKREKLSNSNLSPAYYLKDDYGKRNPLSLKNRFWGNEYAERFSSFCWDWQDVLDEHPGWKKTVDWFDPKQETCHLSGLLAHFFKSPELLREKKTVRLYNIYWDFGNEGESEMEQEFLRRANRLIQETKEANNHIFGDVDFKMGAFSVQRMIANPHLLSRHIDGFGADVKQRMEQFENVAQGKIRKDFKNDSKK